MTEQIEKPLVLQKTKVPPYIKAWYEKTAGDLSQYTQQYASRVLIEYAIANGAVKPEAEETKVEEAKTENKKAMWNEFGDLIGYE